MNAQGLTVMVLSVGSVLMLISYCLFRVLTMPNENIDQLHSELKIDTGDTEDAD